MHRDHAIRSASTQELLSLVGAVEPLFASINQYLDEAGDAERAVPYGDLAQAAMEARLEIDRRA